MAGSGISLDTVGPDGPMRSANQLKKDLCKLTGISTDRSLQQAYSLLEDDEKLKEITLHYQTKIVGPTVRALCHIPWRRIYTLNVDNAFERYSQDVSKERLLDSDRVQSMNFSDDYQDRSPDTIQSIIHLHGFVERPDDGYVFSQSEYAKNIGRVNAWMATLTQLLRAEPFIVTGTTLEEPDVIYYLEQRPTGNHTFSPEVPSILIEPYPDRLTERLCQNHDLILFEGTADTFFQDLSREFSDFVDAFTPTPNQSSFPSILNERDRIRFEETFEKVPAEWLDWMALRSFC